MLGRALETSERRRAQALFMSKCVSRALLMNACTVLPEKWHERWFVARGCEIPPEHWEILRAGERERGGDE
jgi:hypothetical protein